MFEDFFTIYNQIEPPPGFREQKKEFNIPKEETDSFSFNTFDLPNSSPQADTSLETPVEEDDTFRFVYPEVYPQESSKQKTSTKTQNTKTQSVKVFNNRKQFVQTMNNAYRQALINKGLDPNYAPVLVAQDALETRYGEAVIGDYNFGNITTNGKDWHKKTGPRKWKDFKSLEDYVNYKIDFLSNKRYRYFQTFSAKSNVKTSMQILADRGYDPGNKKYGQIVESVYNNILKYLS